jgi:hypothetical protein
MTQSPLLEEFCNCNPSFQDKLNTLPPILRKRFEKKLNNETNRVNFLAIISELHFVKYFLDKGYKLDYEPSINGKTPDLQIKLKGVNVIGDVKRFNLREDDQIKERFFYELATQLQTIQFPYYVHIKQLRDFSYELFEILKIANDFQNWLLSETVKIGSVYNFQDIITIELTNLTGIENNILFSYQTLENIISPNKAVYIIKDKLNYYLESIVHKGYPFFVCVDLLFDSSLNPQTFEIIFQGESALNIDTGVESFILGEFYFNEIYSKFIGILIRYNGKYTWIRNYRTQDFFGLNT